MSDTSLVFNVLGRERVGSALSRVASLFRSAGQQAERATRQATQSTERLDRQIHDVEKSLAMLNAEFAATGNKELFVRMKRDRSLLTQLQSVRREIGAANDEVDRLGANDRASSMLGRLSQAGSDVGSTLQTGLRSSLELVASNAWTLVGAAGAAAAALAAIAPAAFLAGGAVGSLPAIFSGAAAAMATLKLGTIGLAEQWKAQTTATGGAARAARDMTAKHRAVEQAAKGVERAERAVQDAIKNVARAERDVTAAQKDAAAAALAVADAVAEEQRRRRDLATDLASARLDVGDAIDAETDAETALNAARANGADPAEIDDLERAYERAQIAVTQAKNRVEDLTDAQKEADKTTVDGSDAVVAAKDRVKDAQQRVIDAQDAEAAAVQRVTDARDAQKDAVQQLADAQKALNTSAAGGGGGGIVPPAIAASAQKFLDVLKQLRPAFEQLRLGVQEKLFAGLAGPLQAMATAWLPQLTSSLGAMATTFNRIIKIFMATVSQSSFIKNIAIGVEAFRGALEAVGKVAAGPLTTAFGNLAAAAAPFVETLGNEVAKALGSFAGWINKLAQGGKNSKLNQFFRTAADVLKDVFKILRDVGSILGSVLSAIFGQPENGLGPWKSFVKTMGDIAAWFRDPENQRAIREFIANVKDWGGQVVAFFKSIAPAIGPAMAFIKFSLVTSANMVKVVIVTVQNLIGVVKWIGKNAPVAWNAMKNAFGTAKDWIVNKGGALIGWFKSLPGKISSAASGMWNGLRDSFRSAINWVIQRWNNLSFTIPSVTLPLLGTIGGGRLDTPNIPYLAQGGVVPATRGGRLAVLGEGGRDEAVIPLDRAGGMGGRSEIVLSIAAAGDPALKALLEALLPHMRYGVRTAGRGSVQKWIGVKGVAA